MAKENDLQSAKRQSQRIPNVGQVAARDLIVLGILSLEDAAGKDPNIVGLL